MFRTGLVVVLCVACLGCTPEETFRSGTRLRLQWLAAEDGAKVFTGYFDAELGIRCKPSRMTDGVVRCVPTPAPAQLGSLFGPAGPSQRFADDQCTQSLYGWSETSCAPVPRLVTLPQGQGCAAADVVYEVGELVPAGELFVRVGDTCERDPGTPGLSAQRRLTVFDPSKLVELTESEVTLGPVRAVLGRSRDGASVVLHLRDAVTGAACRPDSLELLIARDGPVACLPSMTSTLGPTQLFSGPTCRTPAVNVFSGLECEGASPVTPKVVRVFEQGEACALSSVEFFELGAKVDLPYQVHATCEAVPTQFPVYEVGKKLDPRSFPPMDVSLSGTLLETSTWEVEGRAVGLPSFFWLDGKPCTVTDFTDGTKRCVPSSALSDGDVYADPACTRLAFPGYELTCNAPSHLIELDREACGFPAKKVFRAGTKLTDAPLYFKQGEPARCVAYSQSFKTAWEAGEELELTQFPVVRALAR